MFYFLLFKRQILVCVYYIVLEQADLAGYILNVCKFAFLSPPANPQASRFHVNINKQFFFITSSDEKLDLRCVSCCCLQSLKFQ